MSTLSHSSETIEYEFPDLGLIQIQLHNESAQIYRFLIRLKRSGVEHFERLDQLGGLSRVHKAAHHSRWEYMLLQMYLVQELKNSEAFGFSSGIRLSKAFPISSVEELLKSWVFLNNYGHLME